MGRLHVSSRVTTTVTSGGNQEVWELKLAWQAGGMYMAARRRPSGQPPAGVAQNAEDQSSSSEVPEVAQASFKVDLHSVSDHLALWLLHTPIQAQCTEYMKRQTAA